MGGEFELNKNTIFANWFALSETGSDVTLEDFTKEIRNFFNSFDGKISQMWPKTKKTEAYKEWKRQNDALIRENMSKLLTGQECQSLTPFNQEYYYRVDIVGLDELKKQGMHRFRSTFFGLPVEYREYVPKPKMYY
jgi:hypothetical protein